MGKTKQKIRAWQICAKLIIALISSLASTSTLKFKHVIQQV